MIMIEMMSENHQSVKQYLSKNGGNLHEFSTLEADHNNKNIATKLQDF